MGSTHVDEQLSFFKFPSFLTFDFDLILGQFFDFLGLYWATFGVGLGFDNCFVVYSCS